MSYTAHNYHLSTSFIYRWQKSLGEIIGREKVYLEHVIVSRSTLVPWDTVRACVKHKIVDLSALQLLCYYLHAVKVLEIKGNMLDLDFPKLAFQLVYKRK